MAQNQNPSKALLCTHGKCKNLQDGEGEFCTKHYPKKNAKLKVFNVMWQESHRVIIEASNEDQAIDLANAGYGTDDSVEIMDGFQAYQIKEKRDAKHRKTSPVHA